MAEQRRPPSPRCAPRRSPPARPAPHAQRAQVVRQPVRARVQLRVRQPARPRTRPPPRPASRSDLRLEQLVDARLARVRGFRRVPLPQHQPALGLAEHRQPVDAPAPSSAAIASSIRAQVAQPALHRRRARTARWRTPRSPTIRPSSSDSDSSRSNLAVTCGAASASASLSPGSSRRLAGAFCQANITWKSGLCARLRAGCTRSTTCSKGMSWFCCASSARAFTRPSSSRHRRRAGEVHPHRQRVDEEADQLLDLRPARGWRSACRSPRRPAPRAGRARPPTRPAAS